MDKQPNLRGVFRCYHIPDYHANRQNQYISFNFKIVLLSCVANFEDLPCSSGIVLKAIDNP